MTPEAAPVPFLKINTTPHFLVGEGAKISSIGLTIPSSLEMSRISDFGLLSFVAVAVVVMAVEMIEEPLLVSPGEALFLCVESVGLVREEEEALVEGCVLTNGLERGAAFLLSSGAEEGIVREAEASSFAPDEEDEEDDEEEEEEDECGEVSETRETRAALLRAQWSKASLR